MSSRKLDDNSKKSATKIYFSTEMCEKKLNKRNKIDINYNRRQVKCGVWMTKVRGVFGE